MNEPSFDFNRLRTLKPHWLLGAAGTLVAFGLMMNFFAPQQNDVQAEIALAIPEISEAELFSDLALSNLSGDKTVKLTLKSGDSLGPLLQKNGVTPYAAYEMTKAFAKAYDPRKLRAGQDIHLYMDNTGTEPISLSLKPSFDRTVFVNRTNTGGYIARDITAEFPKELVEVSGIVENSLYLDAAAQGVPDKVTVQFSQIYEHSVDFQRDIHAGDAFTMAFELIRDEKGHPLKAGDLLYTSFAPRGKTAKYYLYKNKAGQENYYDETGKGAKRKLMRTPINGARLTSGFGRRRHPVLGYTKRHNGVDFGARSGTPIMAAGIGVIERANRWSSFGNYIRIRHSDGYQTAYAHLKGFARGIRKGVRVRQGQIIGYVGTTGRSTGPHLHYEVHKNGRPINPSSLSTLSGKPLPRAEKDDFAARRKQIDTLRKDAPPVWAVQKPEPEILASHAGQPVMPVSIEN